MKYLLSLTVLFCITAGKAFSQKYLLNSATNGTTVTTCSGTFYDNGDSTGNYSNNRADTITFIPGIAGRAIRFDFAVIDIQFGDSLVIYDGPNTSAPVLAIFDVQSLNTYSTVAKNAGGSLTVRFKSDNTTTGEGWRILIRCVPPCQSITGSLSTTPALDPNGFLNICQGDFVTITATINYPQNGTNYTQSNALSTFYWKTGFSNDTSAHGLASITKRITQQAGYNVKVKVVDSNGCSIDQELKLKVRTSGKPNFNIAQPASLCLGDTASLNSNYALSRGLFIIPPFAGKNLFLPDGQGVTFSDTIKITDFASNQTLTNINQFLGVFMKMEHSYLGDLDIKLIAPNGAAVTLKPYPGAGNTYLGEPVDDDAQPNVPGIGYQYGFTSTPTYGTMVAEANLHFYNYTDVLGNVHTNQAYLPAGNYTPATPLTGLLGTPLNGNWIIQIKDNLAIDNGYIFDWSLKFANTAYPNVETYVIGAKTLTWLPAAGLVSTTGPAATVSPTITGFSNYTFRIVDSANCTYDTIVKVNVNPRPTKPILGPDKIMCAAQTFNLAVQNPQGGVQYSWSTGAGGTSINVNQLGTYIVTVNNVYSCKSRDTIEVMPEPGLLINLGNDTMFCASNPAVLQPSIGGNITSYLWNDGSTGASLQLAAPGSYWVEASSAGGCKVRDTINVTANPINTWQMPNDTTICGSNLTVNINNAPAGTTFAWFDAATGSSHPFNTTGNYTATATYAGCAKQSSINVTLNPIPLVNLGSDTMFCASNPNVLQANTTGTITTYQWNDGSSANTLPITATGTYWLEVTSDKNCKSRDTVNVINNPINNWQAPNDTAICGSSYLVSLANYPAGTSFLWSDAATGATHSFTNTGLYGITANYAGCLKQDNINVEVNPIPVVNLGSDTMYCASNPNVLQAAVTGTISNYKWNNATTNPTLPITATGTYWLEVTSNKGCKAADTINVINNPINNWQAPNDTSICGTAHTVVLSGYPSGTSFLWNDGTTAGTHTFVASGLYGVTANYIGCLKQDNIDVGVHPVPLVNLGNDTMYCASNPNVLQSAITGNITGLSWNTGATSATLPITGTGLYWLEATTAYGCKHRDTINVTANPINGWKALSDTSICDRGSYTVTLKNYPTGTNFLWYDGKIGASHNFDSAGSYHVTANYIGCLKADNVAIGIRPLPVINIGKDTTMCIGFSLPLKAHYPGASYTWSNGRTDSAILVNAAGFYSVEAKLNGCTYSDTMQLIYVDCSCNVSIPNAFSPNKDGINDVFKVHIECMPANYKLSIYNRYGQPVFETSDLFKGWNGEMKGHKLPVGTYYYILTYYNLGMQKNELYKGYVVLLE